MDNFIVILVYWRLMLSKTQKHGGISSGCTNHVNPYHGFTVGDVIVTRYDTSMSKMDSLNWWQCRFQKDISHFFGSGWEIWKSYSPAYHSYICQEQAPHEWTSWPNLTKRRLSPCHHLIPLGAHQVSQIHGSRFFTFWLWSKEPRRFHPERWRIT